MQQLAVVVQQDFVPGLNLGLGKDLVGGEELHVLFLYKIGQAVGGGLQV